MSKRKSTEAGHRRKFLAVIDDTPECSRAVIYAARRAERTSGGLVMLYVIEPTEFQHWIGVENIMRAEAMDEAEEVLARFADLARRHSSVEPELVIREGAKSDEITALIEEDEDIAILVLAAGTDKEGPGPLVSSIAGKLAPTFPVPITVVPGTLTDDDIAAIA
ncbi:universal stress protein [Kaistia dalseonensis]|uniref:Nucleotide-binding universal stress UspA family protein n=1 Tax=Kaistia dalseonensis TaxID=410840 RepID=A0ABU0H594_9HYPH|nr:universal stress protein [Kaistia dalseonensis]MCX5494897.1 universal stress protein [Kaistia dalseonensis]MDQ0437478.1 nucleotide-binding universal stress UspA family protein [Kaistia dalseonensis]